jgi:hypothetical protein
MENLAMVGLLVGYTWGAAGILGYPGVSWKPGAIIAVACAVWLAANHAMSPEIIEACAVIIFLALMFAREWVLRARKADKPKGPGPE